MVSEKENVEDMVAAYQKGYDIGFIDGKDVGWEEGYEASKDETERDLVPQKWEH